MSKLKPLSLFWEISWEKTNSRDFLKLAPVKVYYFSWRWKKKKSLLCCWVLQYTERVRVPSGNVSGTNFPLQNVPQMFRQMWGTLVPSESVWVSECILNVLDSNKPSLPSPEVPEMSSYSHKWTKKYSHILCLRTFSFLRVPNFLLSYDIPRLHPHSSN